MLYGSDRWAIKKHDVQKMSVVEMKMLRWMINNILEDRFWLMSASGKFEIAAMEDKEGAFELI